MSEIWYKIRQEDLDSWAVAIRTRLENSGTILFEQLDDMIRTITSSTPGIDPGDPGDATIWYKVRKSDLDLIANAVCEMRDYETNNILLERIRPEIYAIVGGPYRIEITTLPTTLVYNDGDTIDFTGMVVTGYNEDDSLWTYYNSDGSIPHSALTFPVTVAEYTEE